MEFSDLILNSEVTEEELDELNDEERRVLMNMVNELIDTGSSNTLKSLWLEDYEEVPVDIDTFIDDIEFLGGSIGDTLYPFWRDVLRELFSPGAKYFECILSGAIGIGKTTVADIGIAYMLHRLLCLKNPPEYYGLSKTSIMTINFFNVTKNLAYGVSYNKLQSMLKNSPWFLRHGTLYGRKNQEYIPGKNIEINIGSQVEHSLGQDVFCVTGDTEIVTDHGTIQIQELDGREVRVFQFYEDGQIGLSDPCEVMLTGYVDELIELELENGSTIRLTPSHKVMLSDGSYKRACELTSEDEVKSI